jgi:hypothetical protein
MAKWLSTTMNSRVEVPARSSARRTEVPLSSKGSRRSLFDMRVRPRGHYATCVNNRKPVYWGDGEDLGVAIRSGNLPCDTVGGPPANVPEVPYVVVLPASAALVALIAFGVMRRRSLLD